jgi:hypothetical protein
LWNIEDVEVDPALFWDGKLIETTFEALNLNTVEVRAFYVAMCIML